MQENLQKISPKEIAQTPLAYSLYVIVAVLVSVIVFQQIQHNSDKSGWEEKEKSYQAQIKDERKEKDEAFKAYLVERGANLQIQKTIDSTAIERFKTKQP